MTKAQRGWVLIKSGEEGPCQAFCGAAGSEAAKPGLSDKIGAFVFDKDVNQSEAETQPNRAAR